MKQFLLISLLVFSCSNQKKSSYTYSPPSINSEPITASFFGKEVLDPFRNIENTNDSTVTNWYKSQTIYADSIINKIPNRETLIKELYEISNRKKFKIKRVNITSNNKIFYLKQEAQEKYYNLYYKEKEDAEAELIFDPKSYKSNSNEDYIINYIKPSWNGSHVVISLTYSGRQLADLIIIDVLTKKRLPQTLKNAWPTNFLGVNWLPDNSGFTYLYFTNTDISDPKFRRNSQSVLHLIEDENDKIKFIFGNKTNANIIRSEKLFPTTKIQSEKAKYIIGYLSDVSNYWDAYYAKIEDIKKGKLEWKPLYKKHDKVYKTKSYFKEDRFVFISAKNAPNKKIMYFNTNQMNINNSKELVPEKETEIIDDLELTDEALYYSTLKYGVDAKLYKLNNNKNQEIVTPKKAGRISLNNKSIFSSKLQVKIRGWNSPNLVYNYNENTNTFVENSLYPKTDYPEFENIISKEILIKSHDGEEIPMSLVYKKNIQKNSKNPVFIYGYGAYGDNESPYFSSIMLNFIAKGGIYCVAHVRGGGEKGDEWHKNGRKLKKQNTWKDLISCTEYLIDQKYTSKKHTAIYGGSAGAIMTGRAMTERPDLFQVVISQVGYLNPFRAEVLGSAGTNTKEFGTTKDSLECLSLINMDPYLNIKENVDYPATYLTVGMNDPIVMPWMTGKFTAKLQKNSLLKKPILMFAEFDEGHQGGSNSMKVYEDWGNIFSFIFWQTGHPDYQPKE